jgi:MEDS: MEthanogen/methylotroph, DcmR Sensory domain
MPARLRKTGIEPMGDLPWGTHFCLFYETKEDLIDTAVPYFKAGLENNEYCVWAVSDPLTVEEATDAIRQATPSLDPHIIESRLEIIPGYRFYLNDNEFDLKQITESWSERLRTARMRNCDGIRVGGNAFWLDNGRLLTPRAREVMGWVACGKSASAVAEILKMASLR